MTRERNDNSTTPAEQEKKRPRRTTRNDRAMAKLFLEEVERRANAYAEKLDPSMRRNYDRDPTLRALDTIATAAKRARMSGGSNAR